MRRQCDGLPAPVPEPVKCADAQSPEAGGVGALRGFQAPVEIPLRPGGVHFRIHRAVVRFLIDHQPVRARLHGRTVLLGFHRADFQRNAWNLRVQRRHALREVSGGDEFGMLPRHQQNVAKALLFERPRLGHHLVDGQRDAQDRIVAREPAVFAIIDALVGKIQGREQADNLAKPLASHGLRPAAERLQGRRARRRNQPREVIQCRPRTGQAGGDRVGARLEGMPDQVVERQGIKLTHKTHGTN